MQQLYKKQNMIIKFLYKGISPDAEVMEAKRIFFANVLAALCLLVSALMIIPYVLYEVHLLAWICLFYAPVYLMCFYYNAQGKTKFAKTLLFSTIALNIFTLSYVFGSKINMSVFYLPLIVILFLLYDKDQKYAFLFSTVIVALICIAGFVVNNFKIGSVMAFDDEKIFLINSAFNGIALFGTVFLTYVFVMSSEQTLKYLASRNETLANERDKLYESTIQLNKTAKEQVDLNELKTKLISIISHDVRQPVNNLLSLSEMMICSKISEQEIKFLGEKLKESALHVYQMLDNLLTWSYSQMNGLHPQSTVFLLKDHIDGEIKKAVYSLENKKITVEVNVQDNIKILFDHVMFEIVFRNILNNAVKFSPEGGNIKIFAEIKCNAVHLSIRDNGIGIPDKIKDKLFSNDLSKSRIGTNNEKGTGIGLMLCKQLLEANNADVTVKSNSDKGTTFELILPCA
jgi:two-component system, sensor histidine kinase and response regulator